MSSRLNFFLLFVYYLFESWTQNIQEFVKVDLTTLVMVKFSHQNFKLILCYHNAHFQKHRIQFFYVNTAATIFIKKLKCFEC